MDFLFQQSQFEAFTNSHWIPLIVIGVLGLIAIVFAKYRLSKKRQICLIFTISLIPLLGYLINVIFPLIEGNFSIKTDLPIHICRILAVTCPIVILKNNRYWMGIFYFWILAGTLNANITPDVENAFPHWSYFSYWMVHSFLIIIPIYYIIVFKMSITFKDLKNAFWMANLFLVVTYFINVLLDSNYMYSRGKPDSASILDLMGPWPIYLITGQLLALVLFSILYLPFIKRKKSED
ncbi:MAG: TIGR02206 family membrane protein [Saprospiraceae bacterium]|nr:TIGR02206 family membrane protein [Bacteroidia bacterium]NNE16784.1 TIGR02206 family membrane protein [Saprospiraceae bacterium]NNL92828.1 TIGR02206 family membrane protein [Saprospiraceae bacterium]